MLCTWAFGYNRSGFALAPGQRMPQEPQTGRHTAPWALSLSGSDWEIFQTSEPFSHAVIALTGIQSCTDSHEH